MIVWRVREKIIKYVLCSIVCNRCTQCNEQLFFWLDLAFLCFYCLLQFICIRFGFFGLFGVIVYLCMCAFVVLDSVSSVLCQEVG